MNKLIIVISLLFLIIPGIITAQENLFDDDIFKTDSTESLDIFESAETDEFTNDIFEDNTDMTVSAYPPETVEVQENKESPDSEIILNDVVVIDTTPLIESKMSAHDILVFYDLIYESKKKITTGVVIYYSGLALELGGVISMAAILNSEKSNDDDVSIEAPTLVILGGIALSSIGPAVCCKSAARVENAISLGFGHDKSTKAWRWYILGRGLLIASLGAIAASSQIEDSGNKKAVFAASATLFTASEVLSSFASIKPLRYINSAVKDLKRLSFNIGPALFGGNSTGIVGIFRF